MAEMNQPFNGYYSTTSKILRLWITFYCIQVSFKISNKNF